MCVVGNSEIRTVAYYITDDYFVNLLVWFPYNSSRLLACFVEV